MYIKSVQLFYEILYRQATGKMTGIVEPVHVAPVYNTEIVPAAYFFHQGINVCPVEIKLAVFPADNFRAVADGCYLHLICRTGKACRCLLSRNQLPGFISFHKGNGSFQQRGFYAVIFVRVYIKPRTYYLYF